MTAFAASTLAFRTLPLEEALARIAAAGVPAVDLGAVVRFCPHADPLGGEPERERVRAALAASGLSVASVNAWSLAHLNDPDGVEREYLRGAVELAAALGAPVLTVQPGRAVEEERWPAQARLVAGALEELGAEARERGVAVTIEALHANTLADSLDRACAFLELARPELLGATLDTSHARNAGASVGDAIRRLGPRIRHVHLRDFRDGSILVTPGDGEIDFAAALARLAAAGYRGAVSIELELRNGTPDHAERELGRALAHLRGLA